MDNDNEGRFVKTYFQVNRGTRNQIWVDKLTGVNYLYHSVGHSGGLTVLLNADGTPIVTPISQLGE